MISSLAILLIIHIFERFAYYSAVSVLIVFLMSTLGWTSDEAMLTYSIFMGVVLIGPLFGGLLSDLTRSPVLIACIGCGLFIFGALGLAFVSSPFLVRAFLMILGLGTALYKPSFFSALFRVSMPNMRYFDLIYGIFFVCVNIAAFLGPWVATSVLESDHPEVYRYGFMIAAAGLIVPLVLFIVFYKTLTINDKVCNNQPFTLTANAVGTIVLAFFANIVFWAGYQTLQNMNVYPNDPEHMTFVLITSLVIGLLIVSTYLFRKFRTAYKISGGMILMALIIFLTPLFGFLSGVSFYGLAIAEILVAPMVYSLVVKTGSPRFTGTLVGGLALMSVVVNELLALFFRVAGEHGMTISAFFGVLLVLLAIGVFLLDYLRPRNPQNPGV